MFDGVYALYVNVQLVRATYAAGFFLFWAYWAETSLKAGQITWLVFGWLPAVFWPIHAFVKLVGPPQTETDLLSKLWTMFPWDTYSLPWILAVVAFVLIFGRRDISALYNWAKDALQKKGDESNQGGQTLQPAKT